MQKKMIINGEEVLFDLIKQSVDEIVLKIGEEVFKFSPMALGKNRFALKDDKQLVKGFASGDHVVVSGRDFVIESGRKKRNSRKGQGEAGMESPMPGKLLKYLVKAGQKVEKGTALLVIEAMKMEHTIKASADGIVEKLLFNEGQLVDGGVELVNLKADKGE
jgi:biotin carboxyl carrier protein